MQEPLIGGTEAASPSAAVHRSPCHAPSPPLLLSHPCQVSTVATFYASAGAGVVGALLTWVFLPDTTGLDLGEIDRMHRYMLAGQVVQPATAAAGLGRRAPLAEG